MAVTLRLVGTGVSGQTKLLTAGTLSIGRGAGNDWVLPDPDRHLSKTHCVISVEQGRAILTDLSTNGVHINGARQATARDSRVVLTDGDEFRLGEYTIAVAEVADARSAGAFAPDPFASGSYAPGSYAPDTFARGGAQDPFSDPPAPAEGRSPLDIDPLDDPLGRPPDPAFRHPVAHRAAAPRVEDPFDMAEERAHRAVDPDDDLFQGARPTADWQGPTQPDNADAQRHAFAAPRVLPTADPGGIDFDALIGDIEPAAAPPSTRQPPPAPPAARGMRDPFADLDNLLTPEPSYPVDAPVQPAAPPPMPPPVRTAPPAQARSAPVPLPADPFADDNPAAVAPRREAPPAPAADPFAEEAKPAAPRPVPPSPVPPPQEAAAPAPAAQAGASVDSVLAAFLEGAGVPELAVGGDPAEAMRAVGQVFRAMTEGLREVLLSRAAIKGDMRVEQTMIRARNNNALKFSVTADDAVSALLNPNRPGYMPPLAATKEAFNDLKSHELAVMAGVQTALLGLLKRFEPAVLESRLSQGLLGSVLPAARKARYWDSFCQVYGDIAREAEDDFQTVFGRAFAKAYTAQSRKGDPAD